MARALEAQKQRTLVTLALLEVEAALTSLQSEIRELNVANTALEAKVQEGDRIKYGSLPSKC